MIITRMQVYSPLRYPGGKAKLAPYIKQLIVKNQLLNGVYVEPYVGGGGVALALLFEKYVDRIIINDKDKAIYAFWYEVLNDADNLCRLICDTPITIQTWKKQKEIQKHPLEYSALEFGFSTFFLNRTNRSGILNAGVIGGIHQIGKYLMDARYNKNELVKGISESTSIVIR